MNHSLAAEEALIGSLLIDSGAFARIRGTVDIQDFFREDHRLIFGAISALVRVDKPIDIVTVEAELQSRGELDKVGGLAYLGRLARDTATAVNIQAYAATIQDHSNTRRLLEFAERVSAACVKGEQSAFDVLLDAEKQLERLRACYTAISGKRATLKAIEVHDFLALTAWQTLAAARRA